MSKIIDGPRLQAHSGKCRQLVVFLHGYGADGADLIEIGRQWRSFLPDAEFVAPHAPERCSMSPMGRQWFPLTMRDLDAELSRLSLNERSLALVGFSQGTMMALHTGLRRKTAPRAILGYSGVLVEPLQASDTISMHQQQPPAVLLVHGEEDELIPAEALMLSANALAENKVPTQWHLSAGLGHGIDNAGLVHGALFLAQSFGIKVDLGPPR
jgi:phospholipase/carboxylesterase